MAGWHHVSVFLQVWDPKGMCRGPESHQGAAPERGVQTWGASREVQGEGGAQCHILGQSVPISTMASAVQDVSPVEAKARGLQTLGQVCVITGQETSKL